MFNLTIITINPDDHHHTTIRLPLTLATMILEQEGLDQDSIQAIRAGETISHPSKPRAYHLEVA